MPHINQRLLFNVIQPNLNVYGVILSLHSISFLARLFTFFFFNSMKMNTVYYD